jgi:phage terminase large subunit-like protein
MSKHPHVDAALKYARSVATGKTLACKWVRLACQRHIDDLGRAKTAVFLYRFDPKKAEKPCCFIELLPHTKGKWASKRETIKLEPWQCFKTVCLFGWVRKQDGLRRFRTALILEPRKNAKSTWAAGIGLYMLCADDEHGAEVYSGATSEKQAWEVFRPARLMAQKTPALLSAYGLSVNASNLHILGNGSRFEPLIGNPGDGASPSLAIADEYHEHDTDVLVDTMVTGMGAREQPLMLIITTAGDNLAGPCYGAVLEAQKMLLGSVPNDELFALMYGVDLPSGKVGEDGYEPGDDWTSEAALRKANPNFDISVGGDFLRSRQREAVNNPRKAGIFKTKHLNMWVQSRAAYFNVQRWIESAQPDLKLEQFANQPCRIGMDLASKIDIAALEILFQLDQCSCPAADRLMEAGYTFARFGKYFLPEVTIDEPENEHYRGWRDEWITQTDGQMIDYNEIKETILDIRSHHQLEEVAYDPHQAMMMVSELMSEGIPVIEVRPLVLNFSEPMKHIDGLIRSRQIAHDGDPVFTWMLSNVVAKPDGKDNVYPRKERDENKIDGPVAQMMAMARFMTMEGGPSVYETRGLIEIEIEEI